MMDMDKISKQQQRNAKLAQEFADIKARNEARARYIELLTQENETLDKAIAQELNN